MKTSITQQDFETFETIYKASMMITRNNLDPDVFDKFAAEHFISKGVNKGDDEPVWIAWHQNKLYPDQTIDNLKTFLYPVVNEPEPEPEPETPVTLETIAADVKEIKELLYRLITNKTDPLF